ncbi:MAG: hypothetical protein JO054_15815, partial [Actinobacteria bacterium]|nr:hypothetical protein [Actinomycetota bacterium]
TATVLQSVQLAYATAVFEGFTSPDTFFTEKANLNRDDPSFWFTATASLDG